MIKQFVLFVLVALILPIGSNAQNEDPVLFSVKNNPVHVSEFLYIYSKTNRDKADFSKASLEEYLDLYTKFKLKVQRAKDMKLDTIPSLQQELAGYRQQLADSYLLDKEVTEKLIKEAYDRSLKDVKISHIMVSLKKNPTPQDTLTAYKRIMQITTNNGSLGYFTSPFPNGFYDFESVAYALPKGQHSNPVRTPIGYHITASKGGYVGFFGISKYEKAFEDAAFALTEDGVYTQPIKTLAGWHIIKRISRKPIPDYDKAKARLKAKIQKDARFELAKSAMVEQIKADNGFKSMSGPIGRFGATLDKEFLTYRWQAPKEQSKEVIFALGKDQYTLSDFTAYLQKESRKRMQMAKSGTVVDALTKLYQGYISETALKYEERNLEAKYPDFKALMREYEEGILLFEITKKEVWDKASQDTTGLKNFYEKNKDKYKWGKRAVVSTYTLNDAAHLSDKVGKFVQKNNPAAVLAKYNKDGKEPISQQETIVERGRNKAIDALDWKVGTLSKMEMNRKDKQITFMKVEKILDPSVKKLSEARGYVVADYQDFLEKQWLTELKKAYKVQMNKKVFKSLIKK